MRTVKFTMAVAALIAMLAAAPNACFQPDSLPGPAAAGGPSSGAGGSMCDCPDDGNPCTQELCMGDSCTHPPEPAGTDCGGGKICDGLGTASSCVDCLADGSSCTGTCPLCPGAPCTPAGQCTNGNCVDGYCCDVPCDGQCQACNVPGSTGTCVMVLPAGTVDDKCMAGQACNASSQCVDLNGKQPIGGPCAMGPDCFNATCVGGFCRLKAADPCSDNLQCETSHCDLATHQCIVCTQDSDCTSNRCMNGNCRSALGEPCLANGDCDMAICARQCNPTTEACVAGGGICKIAPGQACTTDQLDCFSGFCEAAGSTCAICASDADCGATTCNASFYCTLPTGAYCSADVQCQSMSCTGFPPRCQ